MFYRTMLRDIRAMARSSRTSASATARPRQNVHVQLRRSFAALLWQGTLFKLAAFPYDRAGVTAAFQLENVTRLGQSAGGGAPQ